MPKHNLTDNPSKLGSASIKNPLLKEWNKIIYPRSPMMADLKVLNIEKLHKNLSLQKILNRLSLQLTLNNFKRKKHPNQPK